MKIRSIKIRSKHSLPLAFVLAVLFLITGAHSVKGQQWNADGNGNISNANSGKVGIGTSNPVRKLTVSGAAQADIALISEDKGTTAGDGFNLQQSGFDTYLINREAGSMSLWTDSIQRLTILSGGNVGIGTDSPTEKLQVAGNGKFSRAAS